MLTLQPRPFTPVIIKVVAPPTPEVSVVDVLVGALGLTGVLVLGSLVLGLAVGGVLIVYKRWRDGREDARTDDHQVRLDLSGPSR
ncbi:MAG: hypothetical protein AABY89_07555 [Acidobacteriota bacterium]